MKNNLEPEIRFSEFNEDWVQCNIGGVINEISNGMMNRPGMNSLGVKHVNVVNLYSPSYIHSDELKFIDASEDEVKKYNVQVGDIFLTRSSLKVEGIAQANILLDKGTYVFDDHLMRIKLKPEFHPFFVKELLNYSTIKIQFMAKSKTGTMTTIGQSDIISSTGFFPNYKEQTKIGNFLKNLDDNIALHQQELTTLKQTKQGFLQKMFPKEGESVPEVRFPGFTGEWEQRKFKDFISKAGKKNTVGEHYFPYSVSNKLGLISQTEQFDGGRLDDLDKTSYKLVNPNEFAYNPARINVGSIAFNNLNKTVIVSSLYVVIKMSDELDNEFILQFIKSQSFTNEVRRNTEGSVREYLFFENFKNIKFPYTANKDEQIKIGNFFKQLDDTINLHQRELDTLIETKKAFLQQMFV